MIDAALLARGLTFGAVAGLAPGATNALILAQSIRFGWREGLKVAIAPLLTDAPIIALCTWLLTRLDDSATWLGGVAAVGAAVLVLLAVECWRARPVQPDDAPPRATGSIWKGVLANGLNPHPYLFWMTVGAPSLRDAWLVGPLSAVLFLAAIYGCMVGSKAALAVAASRGRRWLQGSSYRWTLRVLAVLLLVFAVQFAWTAWGTFSPR